MTNMQIEIKEENGEIRMTKQLHMTIMQLTSILNEFSSGTIVQIRHSKQRERLKKHLEIRHQ